MLIVETMILNVCDFARSSVFFHLFPLPLDSRYFHANAVVKGRRRDRHIDGLTVNGALQASLRPLLTARAKVQNKGERERLPMRSRGAKETTAFNCRAAETRGPGSVINDGAVGRAVVD